MIRVAGYCRVSTDKEDQANSFESQKRYFREYIEGHPGWMLHEIYADEGITGTTTKKRAQFNRMMNDAYEGEFQLIVTKEVSRFSRNILDTIRFTRELRAIGVGVIFANDRINTLEPEAEMLLSYLASMAQEESRRTSSRVVWGQTRQMERGVVFGRDLLGYDVKNGVLSVEPVGAEVIRLIFQRYAVEQVGTVEIARELTRKGIPTRRGSTTWRANSIIKILNNEKYMGDLVQKKSYTPDFLTHAKQTNRGEVPFIRIENHHEPIISREIWNLAQERLRQNNKHRAGEGGHSNRYVFSGKIKCGQCGGSFVGRCKYRKDGTKLRRWSCGAAGCDVGKLLRDDDAMEMLKTAIKNLPLDKAALILRVTDLACAALREAGTGTTDDTRRMGQLQQKKEALLDSYFSGEITKDDMLSMKARYDRQIEDIRQRKNAVNPHEDTRSAIEADVAGILNGEIESEVFSKTMLEQLTVFKDRHLELRLKLLPQVFHFTDQSHNSN